MNLDELEQGLIQAARRDLGPSAVDRERHRLALAAELGEAPVGAEAGSSSVSSGARVNGGLGLGVGGVARGVPVVSQALRFKLLGTGMLMGAVIGGWVGFGLGRSQPVRTEERAPPAPSVGPAGLAGAAAAPARANPGLGLPVAEAPLAPAAPEPKAAEAPAARITREPDAPPRQKPVASPNPSAAPGPGAQGSSLAVELAMLQRARRALNAGNGRLALGLVHELDERFPKGVLIEERQATRILSLCMLDRTAEARRFAAQFEERYSGSVYAERVRSSCVADAPE